MADLAHHLRISHLRPDNLDIHSALSSVNPETDKVVVSFSITPERLQAG